MELEKLLSLLQAYGVTSYADQELKLELIPLGMQEVDEREFEITHEGIQVTTLPDDERN